ncbi:MAG: TIR domain-containing protein [Sphingomicrobium sp.]
MATVFLSYARDDLERVRPLAAALERAGHTVWWDRHISGGEEFAGAIEEALEAAQVVLVAWSAAAVRSAWVRDEAAAGRDSSRLAPVTLDGCLPPLGFRQFQTIDLSTWNGRARSRSLDPLMTAVEQRARGAGPKSRPMPAIATAPARRLPAVPLRLAIAAGALVLAVSGGLIYSLASGGGIVPKVAIGNFAVVSPDLPRALPQMLGQEIVAAFGAENAVTVIAPGDAHGNSSAPFVMDGSISRLASGVRFTINLRNRRTGAVLWSDAYEHEEADAIAARQAAVGASQIVRCALWGTANHRKRISDEAMSLYFNFCDEHWGGSATETSELDAARRVTVALPDFSFGWSALALAAVPLSQAVGSAEAEKLHREATAAAHKSIALDDKNPEGYMALAGLLPLERYAEREELLEKAISVRPTECGCERQVYGDFLAAVGRMDEAAEQYERARDMRPLAPVSNVRFAQALYVVGRNDEADRVLTDMLQLWPQATSLRLLKMKSALWTRRYDDAIAVLRAPDLPLSSSQKQALTAAFEALKSANPALRATAAAELERSAGDPRRNDRIVVAALAALGAREAALQAAADLVRSRGLFQTEVLFEPNLAAARGEPGFAKLVRSLGLTAYWHAGHAPDICRDKAKPPFCALA